MSLQQRYNTKAAALYRDKVRLELMMYGVFFVILLIDFKVSVVPPLPLTKDITDQVLGNVAISICLSFHVSMSCQMNFIEKVFGICIVTDGYEIFTFFCELKGCTVLNL